LDRKEVYCSAVRRREEGEGCSSVASSGEKEGLTALWQVNFGKKKRRFERRGPVAGTPRKSGGKGRRETHRKEWMIVIEKEIS